MAASSLALPRTSSAKSLAELAMLVDRGHDAIVSQVSPALNQLEALAAKPVWTLATPLNGWVNIGSVFAPLRYRKDALGVVWWDGIVKSGTVGFAAANAIAIAPIGFRPKYAEVFVANSNGAFGEVRVNNYGGFEIVCTVGNNGYVCLNQVVYLAEQ